MNQKDRAHGKVARALKDGLLTRERCESCGSLNNVDAHHDDYCMPLSVRWLCKSCHSRWHFANDGRAERRTETLMEVVEIVGSFGKAGARHRDIHKKCLGRLGSGVFNTTRWLMFGRRHKLLRKRGATCGCRWFRTNVRRAA